MLLKELIIKLQELVKENPAAENYIIVRNIDDEIESFEELHSNLEYGFYVKGEFTDKYDCIYEDKSFNAILI